MSKSILVIDDKGINRLVPGLILRPFGWKVYEAEDGLNVIEILDSVNIEYVLLDISMPNISGLEILTTLREHKKFQSLKIIAYTAYSQPKDESNLLSLGFDAVILKPLTSSKLLDVLSML